MKGEGRVNITSLHSICDNLGRRLDEPSLPDETRVDLTTVLGLITGITQRYVSETYNTERRGTILRTLRTIYALVFELDELRPSLTHGVLRLAHERIACILSELRMHEDSFSLENTRTA
jgi:hypothetical protein